MDDEVSGSHLCSLALHGDCTRFARLDLRTATQDDPNRELDPITRITSTLHSDPLSLGLTQGASMSLGATRNITATFLRYRDAARSATRPLDIGRGGE